MVLKRHISYQWRLFLPLIGLIWLMTLVLSIWLGYRRYVEERNRINLQVELINSRIISAYEHDIDPRDFLDFVKEYYIENENYDEIRISVFHNGNLIYRVGEEVTDDDGRLTGSDPKGYMITDRNGREYFVHNKESNDHRLLVRSVLPYNEDIVKSLAPNMMLYVVILIITVAATIIALLMARSVGRNIRILRDFAVKAATNPQFVPNHEFPHDEVGDISRQLVRMFNERNSILIRLKREHNVAMHAIEEKSRLKRELTSNINHELKTPVGVIKGYVDTILENPDMDEASRTHFLRKIKEHVERLVQLMNDLSSITRLEFGSQMINLEPIDLHEVTFQCASDYETSGLLGDMAFNYDIPTYCRVIGNENLLIGILNNLTKNAVNYSKGTEINFILTGQDDTFYHFAFYDNGNGVNESSLPHLFERFFREDSGRSRKRGGTGLGLPIVLNSVEAMGGTISVSNRDGGGLLFRFTLRKAGKYRNDD